MAYFGVMVIEIYFVVHIENFWVVLEIRLKTLLKAKALRTMSER